ncbi:MAG TPA: hypothetical protein VIK78_12630 [Ruminiclostridium sp.]
MLNQFHKEAVDSTRIMLEIEPVEITADKGYESREDINIKSGT